MDKCREAFETLEDYQTSVRVFNERTRLDYEDFIHKQGQERQKLQLRFTPYTTKKGGYGVADLDHGLQTWQYQQKRIDELRKEKSLQEMEVNQLAQANQQWRLTNDKLQARVNASLQVIKGAARWIDEDAIDDPEFIKGGALRALKRLEQALKGGEV